VTAAGVLQTTSASATMKSAKPRTPATMSARVKTPKRERVKLQIRKQ
jgi:hypothetical protein